jgi:uncharacterized protein (TIGR03437 family)
MTRAVSAVSALGLIAASLYAQPAIVAVANAASWQSGLPLGGALATVFVSGLTGLTPGTYVAPSGQPLPRTLGGVEVFINEDYAPLLAVIIPSDPSANVQINFQVPLSSRASFTYNAASNGVPLPYAGYILVIEYTSGAEAVLSPLPQPGIPNETAPSPLSFGPGFFSSANGYAAAIHASDSSPVTPQNPAHPGESITVYADDFFSTWPPPPIAIPAPAGIAFQLDSFLSQFVIVGNLYLQPYPGLPGICSTVPNPPLCPGSVTNTPALTINSLGLAVGMVGVEAISFVVPSSQQPGNWPLFFNNGSCPDGSGTLCNGDYGVSSPYVLLPVD